MTSTENQITLYMVLKNQQDSRFSVSRANALSDLYKLLTKRFPETAVGRWDPKAERTREFWTKIMKDGILDDENDAFYKEMQSIYHSDPKMVFSEKFQQSMVQLIQRQHNLSVTQNVAVNKGSRKATSLIKKFNSGVNLLMSTGKEKDNSTSTTSSHEKVQEERLPSDDEFDHPLATSVLENEVENSASSLNEQNRMLFDLLSNQLTARIDQVNKNVENLNKTITQRVKVLEESVDENTDQIQSLKLKNSRNQTRIGENQKKIGLLGQDIHDMKMTVTRFNILKNDGPTHVGTPKNTKNMSEFELVAEYTLALTEMRQYRNMVFARLRGGNLRIQVTQPDGLVSKNGSEVIVNIPNLVKQIGEGFLGRLSIDNAISHEWQIYNSS